MTEQLFKKLVYIYIGTSDYEADINFYANVMGAEKIWEFKSGDSEPVKVAAFRLCGEPYLLIADHVHAPSKRLIYEVTNLENTAKILKSRGWKADGAAFEVPDGPCYNFRDASGNEYAIMEMKRPYALEKK